MHVALPHVFNPVTVYFTITYLRAELICHIEEWHLIKEGAFSSKYANYKNVFMEQ